MESAKGTIGIVGDLNDANPTHKATTRALQEVGLACEWVPTTDVAQAPAERLAKYDGIWLAPASPYRSMTGALVAIQYARERGVPLFGT